MRVRIHWHSSGDEPQCSLPFPARGSSRIAQVGDYPVFPGLPWFYVEWWEAMLTFKPAFLVGYRDSLLRLSEMVTRRRIDLPVDGALFTLTRVGERPLLDETRDQFWRAFGVPVFEIYVTGNGIVLASECEAHNGWHVRPQTASISKLAGEPHLVLNRLGSNNEVFQPLGMGFAADVTSEPCECGQTTPRVLNLSTTAVYQQTKLAARALAAAS
jgi:hypothetical protein